MGAGSCGRGGRGLAINKYDFEGIGKAGALLMFSGLAASPFVWFTTGIQGKIVFWLLVQLNKFLASNGLILLNIGIANVQVLIQENAYDKSFDDAFDAIHGNPKRLTEAQKKAIDAPVIAAFDKFANFGVRDGGNP